jgi:6-phosphofructokinase 1
MNTVIRELTLMLVDIYKVNKVVGVKNGFKGYYDRKFMDLNPKVVETIHHFGGCFLGLC